MLRTRMLRASSNIGVWSNLTYVGSSVLNDDSIPAGIRNYSISDTISANSTYFILTSNNSSLTNYNRITGCAVNAVATTAVLNVGTATSYSTSEDRHSAAIFMVSGISGSSLNIDVTTDGSNVYRSIVAVYRVDGNVSAIDSGSDLAAPSSTTKSSVSTSLDIPSSGFCLAFLSSVQSVADAPTFTSGVTAELPISAENDYLIFVPASTILTGDAYDVSASWTSEDPAGSLRLLAASFN